MPTEWWKSILNNGIFIADRQQNPTLYPFLLIAIAVTAVLGAFDLTIDLARRSEDGRGVGAILRKDGRDLLLRAYLPLYALWLGFATPPTQLFFKQPVTGTNWLFLPAASTYTFLAVLLHGILTFFGARGIILAWILLPRMPQKGRIQSLAILAAYVGVVIGWEAQGWPTTFLVLAEYFFMASYIAGNFTGVLWGPRTAERRPGLAAGIYGTYFIVMATEIGAIVIGHDSSLLPLFILATLVATPVITWIRDIPAIRDGLSAPAKGALLLVAGTIVSIVLWTVALILEQSGHQIDPFAINLAAVFCILIQLDAWAAITFGPKRFGRAFFLAPMMAAITLISASGALEPVTRNHGLTGQIWLEGGVAAMLCLLFLPLTELVRESFRKSAVRSAALSRYPQITGPVVDANPPSQRLLGQPMAEVQDDAQQVTNSDTSQRFLPNAPQAPGIQTEYQALQFQAGIVFFILALIYHFIETRPDVLATQQYDTVGLIFAGIAAVAAVIALFSTRGYETLQSILLLFLVIVLGLGACDLWLNALLPSSKGTFAFPQTRFVLFSNVSDTLQTLHNGVQESLFLMASGLLIYLIVVVVARISGAIRDVQSND